MRCECCLNTVNSILVIFTANFTCHVSQKVSSTLMALSICSMFRTFIFRSSTKTTWYFLTTQLYPNVGAYHSHHFIQNLDENPKEVRSEWVPLLTP